MTQAPPMQPLVYSVPGAAAAAGVCANTMRSMIASGEIPHVKVRGRVVVRRATLEKWLADQERVGSRKGGVRRYKDRGTARRKAAPSMVARAPGNGEEGVRQTPTSLATTPQPESRD